MRQKYLVPVWKTAPFIRVLIPFIAGILIQYHYDISIGFIAVSGSLVAVTFFVLKQFHLSRRYKLRSSQGILLQLMLLHAGLFIMWQKDTRNHRDWYGHLYNDSSQLIIKIAEPPAPREKSFKAEGYVQSIISNDGIKPVKGKILLYFARDNGMPALAYGDRILISKGLQQIQSTGNPGAFDYRQYAAFQQIFHNVYLRKNDFVLLPDKDANSFLQFIYASRQVIISSLKKSISKDNSITGIAEALLIGYKEDLDKELVQAYSNTGVVHIIAISGLHLGLIYFMLSWIFNRLPLFKKNTLIKVILILGCLWLFAILTGSSASVLRSAVMFTCILIGNTYFKRSSVYNSLASSACLLLCYDPCFLWDAGFQLSYLAIIGIVWLQQPIAHLLYLKNKWLRKVWEMATVTIAAQLMAFPVCLYYFHQFPNLFLVTNLIAVPLSTVILFAEIFLLCISWTGIVCIYTGKLITAMIWLMNLIVTSCNELPFSVTDDLYCPVLNTWLLYGLVIFVCCWLLYNNKIWLRCSAAFLLAFVILLSYNKINAYQQQKLIVYNVPRYQAIDLIAGNTYYFIGDSLLRMPGLQQNFYLKPARISLQAVKANSLAVLLPQKDKVWMFAGERIMIIDKLVSYLPLEQRIPVDILIISHNPEIQISHVVTGIDPGIIIFDSSNSLWKIAQWKTECSALLLRFYSVPEQGAFVFDINQALSRRL